MQPFRLTDRTCSKMAARVNTIALLRHTLAFYMQVSESTARVLEYVMSEDELCICLSACIACQNLHGCFKCHSIQVTDTCIACLVMPFVFMRLGGRVCLPSIFLHNHIHIHTRIHITHSTGTKNNVMDFATMDKRFSLLFSHFVAPNLCTVSWRHAAKI